MTIRTALAAVAVDDLATAKAYYTRLFRRPPDSEPMPSLAQWDLDSGGVQVVRQSEVAGRSMVTLMVHDFDAFYELLRTEGFRPSPVLEGVLSKLTQISDPDGNVITVAEIPTGSSGPGSPRA